MNDPFEDPQFLRNHSLDPEWPGYEAAASESASLPLLISEIYRLIPYIGSKYVQFSPKNMPEITVKMIDIVGIVTEKSRMAKYTTYTVDDGTGAIDVLYPNHAMSENEWRVRKESANDGTSHNTGKKAGLKAPFGLFPGAPYTYERHILNLWYQARDEEFSHNEVMPYDYIHVIGYCNMLFREKKDITAIEDEDIKVARLSFYGRKIRSVSEAAHNAMIKSLITQVAWKRYVKPKVS